MQIRDFETLADLPEPRLDELALAIAGEFRTVDTDGAMAELDRLGEELRELAGTAAATEQADACRLLLGERHGFVGNREEYDHPDNSMLDLVLERRRGLPILLSVVYVETARRAGFSLGGVGLPGHYVVGHFGAAPPLLLDPFSGGAEVAGVAPEVAEIYVRPWAPHETALRILNNLMAAYESRADFSRAIRAAQLRLLLPLDDSTRTACAAELRALQADFN